MGEPKSHLLESQSVHLMKKRAGKDVSREPPGRVLAPVPSLLAQPTQKTESDVGGWSPTLQLCFGSGNGLRTRA